MAKARLTPEEAHEILEHHKAHGDYFALPHSTGSELADAARKYGYRKGKYAPGSTSRMFHGYLTRLASKSAALKKKI